MKQNILRAILVAALSASFLCSQTTGSGTTSTPPTPPTPAEIAANIVARLTTLLDLTSAQQLTATNLFTTEQTALATISTSMQTAQTALQTAVTAASSSGVTTAANQIGSLTTQQVLATANADLAFYAILTATQQTKYATLQPPGQGGPGPGGQGGPGGSGGPGGPPPPKQ
jgi:Spy/CpxP family protein refolding chaperone